MKPLNLAAQPFRNERLGELLFAIAAAALLALTAWHATVIHDLLPARTSGLHREVAALQTEIDALRKEAAGRRTETPPAPVLAQWALVKELVDRRTFSWAALFASLEEAIPIDVRLTSIAPSVTKGQVEVDVSATVRDPAAGWEFVRALQGQGEFYDVYPTSEADREFRYKFRYRPRPRVEGELAGPPAPGDAGPEPSSAPGSRADAGASAAGAPVTGGPAAPAGSPAGPPAGPGAAPPAAGATPPANAAPAGATPPPPGNGLRARGARLPGPRGGRE